MFPIVGALIATLALPPRSVVLPLAAVSKPIHVDCPVGHVTRIVLPERLILLKASAGAADDLGVAAEQSSPLGVIGVTPVKVASGTLEARGPTLTLTIVVKGVETGVGSEVRLTLAPAPRAKAPETPVPTPAPEQRSSAQLPSLPKAAPPSLAPAAPSPSPQPTPTLAAPPRSAPPSPPPASPVPTGGFDAEALKSARAVGIGRREGLPGEPEMVLDTAYRGERCIWLRFYLRGAPRARVQSLTWDAGEIHDFVQETSGKDLRITAQLPRDRVNRKTRLTVRIASGGTYRFALNSGTFADFLRDLFR